jgi:YfiH family protein
MEITRKANIHYLEPGLFARHGFSVQGFTTRHEGVSRPPYNSLNLGLNTLDTSHNVHGNRSLLARTFGCRVERLVTVTQVHRNDLLVIDEPNTEFGHFQKLECDGIVTNQPGVMIAVGVADCLPILLLDPDRRVVAALHAGWKGTAGGIAVKGVDAMVELFGSKPDRILAALGPAIGPCCYEVDLPVREAFGQSGAVWDEAAEAAGEGRWRLDLVAANRRQLLDAGVREEHLETAGHCVSCAGDWFFSYRRDGGETGRQAGFIMLVP